MLCYERRFGHNHLRNCYRVFTEQFDLVLESDVMWEPYHPDNHEAAYPGDISNMCTKDLLYWMIKDIIIFDIFVEEMWQQRVMRYFGLPSVGRATSCQRSPTTMHPHVR
jgi:hypothetical protein